MNSTREELMHVVRALQRHCCAYEMDPPDPVKSVRCDCKFGASRVGRTGSEAGNGCPELREVYALLEVMTPVEFARLDARLAARRRRKKS